MLGADVALEQPTQTIANSAHGGLGKKRMLSHLAGWRGTRARRAWRRRESGHAAVT